MFNQSYLQYVLYILQNILKFHSTRDNFVSPQMPSTPGITEVKSWDCQIFVGVIRQLIFTFGDIFIVHRGKIQSPPLHLPKFLFGFCVWKLMVSSIWACNKTYYIFLMSTEYYIMPILCLPSHPFLCQGNMISWYIGLL